MLTTKYPSDQNPASPPASGMHRQGGERPSRDVMALGSVEGRSRREDQLEPALSRQHRKDIALKCARSRPEGFLDHSHLVHIERSDVVSKGENDLQLYRCKLFFLHDIISILRAQSDLTSEHQQHVLTFIFYHLCLNELMQST